MGGNVITIFNLKITELRLRIHRDPNLQNHHSTTITTNSHNIISQSHR